MPDKPLDRADQELLALIEQLFAADGPIDRIRLSVEARGRGLEVGRPLVRLKSLGLVEEFEKRPFFLKRLIGVKSVFLVQPVTARTQIAPPPALDIVPDPQAEPTVAALPVEAISEPEAMAEPVPTPEEPVPVLAVEAPIAPSAPEGPANPPPAPRKRTPVLGYTEDLGGIPMADTGPAPVDPALIDSLREILDCVGMEITQAGEVLVADRLAKGATPGEALSQVVLFAFAHAVRYDAQSGGEVQALGLDAYAIEVMRELEKLRDADAISEAAFESDMRQLWALVQNAPDSAALAESLLTDPIGGAAPTALLPEDLRHAEEA